MIKNQSWWYVFLLLITAWNTSNGQNEKHIIYLSWKNVVDISLEENLDLKLKSLDYEIQGLETWKSLSLFLPSLTYQGIMQRNVELPVFVFMGQKFAVGSPYNFQHSLSLSFPIFTGGSRWVYFFIFKKKKKKNKKKKKKKKKEKKKKKIK